MSVKGFVTVMASSLECSIENADWHFSLRRSDGKTHDPFFNLHEKEVSSADIAIYLPNWQSLQWKEIKDSMMGKSESYAVDVEFKINVQSSPKSNKSHKEVVDAFLAFMQGK